MSEDSTENKKREKPENPFYAAIDFLYNFKIVGYFIVFMIIVYLLLPYLRLMNAGEQLVRCENNLKDIGTALEMFSTDHSGHYPYEMKEITPGYMKSIPTCPAAGMDTYSLQYMKGT